MLPAIEMNFTAPARRFVHLTSAPSPLRYPWQRLHRLAVALADLGQLLGSLITSPERLDDPIADPALIERGKGGRSGSAL